MGVILFDGADARGLDVFGRVEIGRSDGEAHHVPSVPLHALHFRENVEGALS